MAKKEKLLAVAKCSIFWKALLFVHRSKEIMIPVNY